MAQSVVLKSFAELAETLNLDELPGEPLPSFDDQATTPALPVDVQPTSTTIPVDTPNDLAALLAELEAAATTLTAISHQDQEERTRALHDLERYDALIARQREAEQACERAQQMRKQAEQLLETAFADEARSEAQRIFAVTSQIEAATDRIVAEQRAEAERLAAQLDLERLLATYLQALLAYPDACTRAETVLDPVTGSVIAQAPALSEAVRYPKEQALLELVRRERARGRRVRVYITHTERRDISPRLRTILERAGFRVAVLKAGTVAPDRREEWVTARVREGADVLICHPRLVQTGLDLIDWPSIVWFQTEYSVYVMRQASRRSWRIGQRQPVEVTYLGYEGTLQADALTLVATKLRASLMVEGELPEEGLAALDGDGQDLFLALARRLTEQAAGDGQSLEALFARTKEIEAEADDYLVDGTWESGHQPSPALPAGKHISNRQTDDPIQPAIAGEQPAEASSASRTSPVTDHQPVAVDDFTHLIRRSKVPRKPVPAGQLRLFDE